MIWCLSICLSKWPAAVSCGGFAAVGPVGSRYRSIAAWLASQQQGATARHAAANVDSATFSACIGS